MIPFLSKSHPTLAALTDADQMLAAHLRRDVTILASDIGPRGTHSPRRYQLARHVLERALQHAGYEPVLQTFEARGVDCANIEVTIRGTAHPDRVLIIGAHYDSVEACPAANDNASGVAGVLAVARALAGNPRACTVRCVLFANEEPPFFNLDEMGSQLYARACRARGDAIRGMVCLETIGCYSNAPGSQAWPVKGLGALLPTVGDFIAMVGPSPAKPFIRRAARAFTDQAAFPLLAAAVPARIDQVNWSDHRGFNEVGYPGFMLTDTAFLRYPHYHRPTDTPEKLDYESMARVVRGVIGMIDALAMSPL